MSGKARREAVEMSKSTKQQELEREAQKSFSKEERARDIQRRFVAEEERRHVSNASKTGRLRAQRLARDAAAEADAAKVTVESEPLKVKVRRQRWSPSQNGGQAG
jgi:hypothetical protein